MRELQRACVQRCHLTLLEIDPSVERAAPGFATSVPKRPRPPSRPRTPRVPALPCRTGGGLHVLLLFGRRQDGLHSERLEPQLATPAFGVVQVLVFLILDLLVGLLERSACFAVRCFGALADQLPVGVVLGFGEHDALASHELRGGRIVCGQSHLHREDERLPRVLNDFPPGSSRPDRARGSRKSLSDASSARPRQGGRRGTAQPTQLLRASGRPVLLGASAGRGASKEARARCLEPSRARARPEIKMIERRESAGT